MCINEGNYTIDGTTSTGGTILWTSSGDGSFSDDTFDNPTYTFGSETGSVTLTKTVTSAGSCADSVDAMVLTLTPVPVSDAGPDDEVCASEDSYAISGTTSTSGSIVWTSSGDGSFDNDTIDNPTYTIGSETGSVTLTKSVNGAGSCADSIDAMVLTLTPVPFSDAGPDTEVCIGEGSFMINGTTSTGGTVLWTSSGDGSFSDDTFDNPTYTFGSETGSVTLTKTVTSAGSCADSVDAMVLTLTPVPVSDAGPDAEVCAREDSYTISGTTSTGGSILWTSSGDGSFDNDTIDNPTYTIGSETGSVTLTKSVISAGSCADSVDAMVLTLTPVPVSDAGPDAEVCIGEGSFIINGTTSSGGTILWTSSGDGSFDDNTFDNPTYTFGSETGSVTLTKTVTSPGSCTDSVDTMVLSLLPQPIADAGSDGETCLLTFQLQAIPNIGTGGWTLSSGPGTAIFSPTSEDPDAEVTVNQYGIYGFTWTETSGPCSDADTVFIHFLDGIITNAGTDDVVCGPVYGLNAIPAGGSGSWSKASGPGNAIFSPSDTVYNAVVTVDDFGTYEFHWNESLGNCNGSDMVEVSFNRPPIADAGPDQVLEFVFSTRLEGNIPEMGTGIWSLINGSGQIVDENDPVSEVTELALNENEFQWKISLLGCEDVSDNVVITVKDIVTPTVITPNGDGQNDYLVFPGIDLLPGSELIIYNRWGTEVYTNPNYQNDWDGRDHKSRELIPDTYYYILKIESERIIKGFVEIRK